MTQPEQYDTLKQHVADMFREMDAVDEVLADVKALRGTSQFTIESLEVLIEHIEDLIHYDEPLEYILRQIPNQIKTAIIQEMA